MVTTKSAIASKAPSALETNETGISKPKTAFSWKALSKRAAYAAFQTILTLAASLVPLWMFYDGKIGYASSAIAFYASVFLIPLAFRLGEISKEESAVRKTLSACLNTVLRPVKLTVILVGTLMCAAIYVNEFAPAEMKTYELTDSVSGKTVVFQQMAHIASESFYASVKDRVSAASASGYVLYYEQVGIDGQEDIDYLTSKMGFLPTGEFYEAFAKSLGGGLTNQDNVAIVKSSKDAVRADVNISDMRKMEAAEKWLPFEAKPKTDSGAVSEPASAVLPTSMIATSFESAESVPTLSAKTFEEPIVKRLFSNEIFKYLLKMEFNIVAIHPAVQDALLGVAGADTSFFSEKVVDYRNFELSKKVNESSEKKIIITYGALHFPGFLAEIRKTGGSWSVKEISSEKVFP